jgi:hypothetical protein
MNHKHVMAPLDLAALDLSADTPQVAELVTQFHQFARKSAEGVLEMARVVKAASLLSDADFYRFCDRTDLKAGSSTARKLITIGEKYNFLITQADKLPANWTTIYAVARLANEQIQTLIDQGVVNTNTAAAELERALSGKTRNRLASALTAAATPLADATATATAAAAAANNNAPPARKPKPVSFKVQLDDLPDEATLQGVKHLIGMLSAMKTKVTLSDGMTLALKN